jgi:hypothetical protein
MICDGAKRRRSDDATGAAELREILAMPRRDAAIIDAADGRRYLRHYAAIYLDIIFRRRAER